LSSSSNSWTKLTGGSTTGREHADFWQPTVQTRILDTELGVDHSVYGDLGYGEQTVLSLATAFDMLWPCHWDIVQNLENVLGVIGGDPSPRRPFAFCARNIKLSSGCRWTCEPTVSASNNGWQARLS
jgi:hypothetical protein